MQPKLLTWNPLSDTHTVFPFIFRWFNTPPRHTFYNLPTGFFSEVMLLEIMCFLFLGDTLCCYFLYEENKKWKIWKVVTSTGTWGACDCGLKGFDIVAKIVVPIFMWKYSLNCQNEVPFRKNLQRARNKIYTKMPHIDMPALWALPVGEMIYHNECVEIWINVNPLILLPTCYFLGYLPGFILKPKILFVRIGEEGVAGGGGHR